MELALDQWYFQEAKQFLQNKPRRGKLLLSAINLDADLVNILTALRFAQYPTERNLIREWHGTEELSSLFCGPGLLPFALLARAGSQDMVAEAVETLAGTPYETPLRAGLQAFVRSGRLSEFEKRLRRFRLDWITRLIPKDPLGIGVVLGYLALKINEVKNIFWIAQGINLGLKVETIRAEVEFVT
jgi:vacuolar-type H+-ATPase subunit C/Vma6